MRLKYVAMLFAVLALSLTLFACSSGDDDAGSNGDQPTATTEPSGDGDATNNGDQPSATKEASGDGDSGGFGTGTATLTIGDETWEISGVGCVFSAEEAQNPDFPFNLSGFGESSTGARAQLSADVYDPSGQERLEGDGVRYHIKFIDIEDFDNPSVSWSSFDDVTGLIADGTMTHLEIDGKDIHGEGVFGDGTKDDIEKVPGTLEVSCP